MTHMSFMSCPSLLLSFARYVLCGGSSRMALETASQRPSASAAAAYGACCTCSSMLVSGHRPVTYASNVGNGLGGLHPQPKWRSVSTCVDSTAAHRLALWEGCGPPSWTASRSGRTSRPGGLDRTTKAPEPTGRASCCPLRV